MKKLPILLVLAIFSLVFSSTFSSANPSVAARGKIVANNTTILKNGDKKQKGILCVLDQDMKPTGKTYKIIKRKFPDDFKFADDCEKNGTLVNYKIISHLIFWKRAQIDL